MPEEGVNINAERMPPREYLMRRSYHPEDAKVPGAVVRRVACSRCGYEKDARGDERCPICRTDTVESPRAIDVPLVKENGERWR